MKKKRQGAFLVLEGIDGSGKETQTRMLARFLRRKGKKVTSLAFPRYGTRAAYFVEQYLRGKYGGVGEQNPAAVALCYAMDRFDSTSLIERKRSEGYVVLADRYTASNFGHQAAQIRGKRQRQAFLRWVRTMEYEVLGIARPDCTIILEIPPAIALRLLRGRKKKGVQGDIHERDARHLAKAHAAYLEAARLFPREIKVVHCAPRGVLLSPQEIQRQVYALARPFL